ncbi:MAG: hypothetical protein HOP91_06135 [Sphingomonas sp.]|nr:hypothetical protein [Sphingomonas sp.]
MRTTLILLPLLLAATPAPAQPVPQLPPQLTDPATTRAMTDAMQGVTQALLDMRIGEIKAAMQGREATPAEKRMTVRDVARRDDPDFDRHLQHKIANVGPTVQRSMNAVNQAMPAVMQSLMQAQQAVERAVANLPDPTYPRR